MTLAFSESIINYDSIHSRKNVSIIGAGLVGTLLSVILSRKGFTVDVFEKRSDLRKVHLTDDRSINLALSYRGWQALNSIGIADAVRTIALPMHGRMIHSTTGELRYQPYGSEGEAIYSISRNRLNGLLLDLLEQECNAKLHFNHRLLKMDIPESRLYLEHNETQQRFCKSVDLIIGADGAHSTVRNELTAMTKMDVDEEYLEQSYKQFTLLASPSGGWQLDPTVLHIWPRGSFMMIALPNPSGTFTCTLFLSNQGINSFQSLNTKGLVDQFFADYFPDIANLIHNLADQFERNPTSSLKTVRCEPWTYQDKVVLIGDAAHSIVPFYGQGMNAGFEDCTVLGNLLSSGHSTWADVLRQFYQQRKYNTDAIAELSLKNFVEMRHQTADPNFLLRKTIDGHLGANYPQFWRPLYTMVSFSDVPYVDALQIGLRQEAVLNQIMSTAELMDDWQNLDLTPWLTDLLPVSATTTASW